MLFMSGNLFITKIFVFQCSQNLWKNDGFVCFEVKALYNTGHGHIVLGASIKPHQKDYMAVLPGKISDQMSIWPWIFCFVKIKVTEKSFQVDKKNLYNLEHKEILWHNLPQICTLRLFFRDWWKFFQDSFRRDTQIFEDLVWPVAYKWDLMTLVLCQRYFYYLLHYLDGK